MTRAGDSIRTDRLFDAFKDNITNNTAVKAKEAMKKFYQSTDLDHENYVLPED